MFLSPKISVRRAGESRLTFRKMTYPEENTCNPAV